MSQTAALLTVPDEGLRDRLRFLARKYSFSLLGGLENCSPLVRAGIENFITTSGLKVDVLFFSGTEKGEGAWFIQEELRQYRINGVEPKMFSFLRESDGALLPGINRHYFISAHEWDKGDEVLFLSGTIAELIGLLALTKSLDLPLWQPQTARVQEVDRYPLVFEILREKKCDK